MKLLQRNVAGISRWLMFLVRLGLGCMFLWSALPKIRQPCDFLASVYSYGLVGPKVGLLVAMILPWMALLVGICLLSGVFVSRAWLISTGKIGYVALIRAIAILLVSAGAYLALVLAKPHADKEAGAPIKGKP